MIKVRVSQIDLSNIKESMMKKNLLFPYFKLQMCIFDCDLMGYDAQWIPEACKNVCLDLLPW
jgi:hypothetical protein